MSDREGDAAGEKDDSSEAESESDSGGISLNPDAVGAGPADSGFGTGDQSSPADSTNGNGAPEDNESQSQSVADAFDSRPDTNGDGSETSVPPKFSSPGEDPSVDPLGPDREHDSDDREQARETTQHTQTQTSADTTASGVSIPENESVDHDETSHRQDWGPERQRVYNEPETTLELLEQVDAYLDAIDTDLETARERRRAGDLYKVADTFGDEQTAQSKLGFDYVRDDGIIVSEDTFTALLYVKPTRYLSLDEESRRQKLQAYQAFIKSLKWGIAIPSYLRDFEFEQYYDLLMEAGAKGARTGENPLLSYGRREHLNWFDENVDVEAVKKREFYIVVKTHRYRAKGFIDNNRSGGWAGLLRTQLRNLLEKVRSQRGEEKTEQVMVDELQTRRQVMKKELVRTGVEVEFVTERPRVMDLLFHYYNHVEPHLDEWDHGTFSTADPTQM